MANKKFKRPALGDPGLSRAEKYIATVDKSLVATATEIGVESLSEKMKFDLALSLGADIKELLRIDHCWEHFQLQDLATKRSGAFSYATDVVYCFNCFGWFLKAKRVSRV